ncbi:hypothetical protein QE152_g34438 [Popillia japonica]|uniref:Uncharacterized protein n=1 Tax=Popillia japonica TaxID=7064 RepID=A0AAW1ITZ7_POPJA
MLGRNLEVERAEAEEKIMTNQTKNEENYNKHRRKAKEYKVGQYVMISNVDSTSGANKKLIPKYRGPYQIKTKLPNDRYVVTDIPGFQQTQIPYDSILDVTRLTPYDSN